MNLIYNLSLLQVSLVKRAVLREVTFGSHLLLHLLLLLPLLLLLHLLLPLHWPERRRRKK